jgi:hypothetical protein
MTPLSTPRSRAVERHEWTSSHVGIELPVGRVSPRITMRHPTGSLAGSSRPVGSASGQRPTVWIVRTIIIATTAFALLDLVLLVSSVHH